MPQWIKCSNGLTMPKDTGATDFEDSARLAGVLAAAKHPQLPPAAAYIRADGSLGRWFDSSLPFTRDQLVPLAYFYRGHCPGTDLEGYMRLESKLIEASKRFTAPNGKDLLAPHHRSHLQACVGGSWSWLGKLCLIAEIYWHAHHEGGLSEPNQLICMLLTAGAKYVRLWKRANPHWAGSIRAYWCGWRTEPMLAESLIIELGDV